MNTLDNRQDYKTRFQFEKSFNDLKDILKIYKKEYHYFICISYLKAYHFNFNDVLKGKLLYKLNVL